MALPSLDRQTENEFLSFFDANSTLNNSFDFGADYISTYINEIKKELQTKLRNYHEIIKQKYKNGSGSIINKTIALLEINNEYIVPRIKQAENKEVIDRIQKGDLIVTNEYQIYEQFLALFNMYKMLSNHPQNTKEQSVLQKEKMYARAKELGAVECFEEVLAEKRLIKLDETNYIKYLREIASVLDDECASEFINTLANDITDCMIVDVVMEPYENEIMQNIARTFSDFLIVKRHIAT